MTADDLTQRALDLRAARLTPVTSHPRSLALLTACAPEQVPWAFAAAEAAVQHGRPPGEVIDNLRDHLAERPMPTDAIEWAVLVSTL